MPCEHCGRNFVAMVAMLPGKDGKEWFLCGRCYEDGLTPMRVKVVTTEVTTAWVKGPLGKPATAWTLETTITEQMTTEKAAKAARKRSARK